MLFRNSLKNDLKLTTADEIIEAVTQGKSTFYNGIRLFKDDVIRGNVEFYYGSQLISFKKHFGELKVKFGTDKIEFLTVNPKGVTMFSVTGENVEFDEELDAFQYECLGVDTKEISTANIIALVNYSKGVWNAFN